MDRRPSAGQRRGKQGKDRRLRNERGANDDADEIAFQQQVRARAEEHGGRERKDEIHGVGELSSASWCTRTTSTPTTSKNTPMSKTTAVSISSVPIRVGWTPGAGQ